MKNGRNGEFKDNNGKNEADQEIGLRTKSI